MLDKELEITIGALLHDIGKVIYREGGEKNTHSEIGYNFLKTSLDIKEENILDCVRYHHAAAIRKAGLQDASIAYIVYLADNIASSVDRRNKEVEESGFEIHTPLQPVFNLLNGNTGDCYYTRNINVEKEINYPTKEKTLLSPDMYHQIVEKLADNLKGLELKQEYVNSLLEVMESNLSFVPSSTSKEEVPDISLYDHVKLTAAFALCMMKYLQNQNEENYHISCFDKENEFYDRKAFLISSLDFSGIQDFIYTIQSKNALKTLRARSFYLELLMEHAIDELVEKLGVSRCNLLYAGGGHSYLLLPNTEETKKAFDSYIQELNQWMLDQFQVALYVAGAYEECSASDLKNIPVGSYQKIFQNLSGKLSLKKLQRYDSDTLKMLNCGRADDYSRECSVCKKESHINAEGLCPLCAAIEKLSANVLYADFFTILKDDNPERLPLPGGYSLGWDDEDSLKNKMENDSTFARAYSKNKSYTGKYVATKLWVGNYTTKATFEEFANSATGIKRVGIMRADVDNLGQAFVAGFANKENQNRYVTISRTATLSRQLSLFFKLHINKILENPEFSLDGKQPQKRNITIVYSGGDDVFVVGAWNEVIEFSVDLKKAFEKYTENTLSISAGIGLYDDSFPISVSAKEVEELVDASKDLPNKRAITLLPDGEYHSVTHNGEEFSVNDGTYHWDEFETRVIQEKYKVIDDYFSAFYLEHGNALLYRILELIRAQNERINFARFIYLMARLEPTEDAPKTAKEEFQNFSKKMIEWIKNPEDQRQLKTAIELYVYLHRGEEEH